MIWKTADKVSYEFTRNQGFIAGGEFDKSYKDYNSNWNFPGFEKTSGRYQVTIRMIYGKDGSIETDGDSVSVPLEEVFNRDCAYEIKDRTCRGDCEYCYNLWLMKNNGNG